MLKMLALLALLLAPVTTVTNSPGCGKPLSSEIKTGGTGSSNKLSLTSDGLERTYLLHLPAAYDTTRPHGLIFSFHGRGSTSDYQERLSKFSNDDVNPHMLAVYPDGIDQQWQGDPDAKTDDVKFTLAMIEKISQNYCIDMEKVYASGFSNGGGFAANILACDPVASTKIAAFASFSGAYYQKTEGTCDAATVPITCNPGRKPVPIFEVHGSADNVIAYDGGERRSRCLPSLPHFMTEWAKRNGLGSTNESTTLEDGDVIKYEFGKGELEGVNTHYWVEGLGHSWPDTSEIDGSELAMEFFEKWELDNVAGSTSTSSTRASSSTSATSSASSSRSTMKPSTADTKIAKPSATTKTTSSTSPSPSTYPSPSCPAANGSTWSTPAGKNKFQILCGYDTTASYYREPIYELRNFGKCISACEEDSRCGHAVYNGVCYLKRDVKGLKKTAGDTLKVAIKQ